MSFDAPRCTSLQAVDLWVRTILFIAGRDAIPESPDGRRQILQRLIQRGLVRTYSVDGKTSAPCV